MGTEELQARLKTTKSAFTLIPTRLLQRKCACGGTPGVDGECAECRNKQLTLQQSATHQAEPSAVSPIVHDVLRSSDQSLDSSTHAFIVPRFGHDFSRVRVHPAAPGMIQAKLTVNRPGDKYEQEADRVAEQVMRMPQAHTDGEEQRYESVGEQKTLQAREIAGSTPNVSADVQTQIDSMLGSGQPLQATERAFFEPRFGHNFSQVRVHADTRAAKTASAIGAQAFTIGRDIVFGRGQYAPGTSGGRNLLAHELTHVVQQGRTPSNHVGHINAAPSIQRRLVTFGTLADVNALLGLLGPAAGLTLTLDIGTSQVRIGAVLPGAPRSPSLRAELTAIINHATQHAEVAVGRGQPGVLAGAFPQPTDLTVTKVQRLDIDDILAVEAATPGNGVAFAAHEIEENFRAHGVPVVPGKDRFARAHEQAIDLESKVASELVAPGRRVAEVVIPTSPTTFTVVFDYESYYLVFTSSLNAVTRSQDITGSRRSPKVPVSRRTIDNFATDSAAIPGPGGPTLAAVAADVAANPTSTVLVEGFADSAGSAGANARVTQHRAEQVRNALVAAGVPRNRIHIEGRGATNFVAANDTDANRALNRRVVITVTRPVQSLLDILTLLFP